jgi:DNA-binding transcriptional MerR regulator
MNGSGAKPEGSTVTQIGEFASQAGVSVRTVRYYEELGLLRPEDHSRGGFRLYGPENRKRITVISFLKDVGLSLSEIRRILLAKQQAGGDREAVALLLALFGEKLRMVEAKIETLNAMRVEFTRAIELLHSCRVCGHDRLLDVLSCSGCANLNPPGEIPETFRAILR